MKRLIVYLTWAWEILIGALLITPRGVICIACGTPVEAPGYIGETATIVLGVIAILLGIYGIATAGGARTVQPPGNLMPTVGASSSWKRSTVGSFPLTDP